MRRRVSLALPAACALLASPLAGAGECAALLRLATLSDLPGAPTTLTAAAPVAATPDLPAYCRVEGYVAPQVRFELRLPEQWNGRFLMQGCGGLCGAVRMAPADDALARGYAVVATDMGHSGQPWQSLWAYNNLPAEIDFAYRATHVVTVAAKAIVAAHYDGAPEYSYFRGCSTGGRQGMVEAQRYPDDFDGIIAGAPVLDETATAALHLIWSGRANLGDDDAALLEAADVERVHRAAIAACDADDGRRDGVIEYPPGCDFRPAELACGAGAKPGCLDDGKLAALDRLYRGASDSAGRALVPGGLMPGSEYEWVPNFVGRDGPAVFHPDGPVSQLYQYLVFYPDPGPGHSARLFDFDRDPPRLATMESLYTARNPDLRRFRDRGGRLLVYQGWDDVEVTPLNTIDYFQTLHATMGGAAATGEFARLYMMPGVAHCRRGPGADIVDWLTVLEDWVERDRAPDSVTAYHPVRAQTYLGLPRPRFPLPRQAWDWQRPLYPWPATARFESEGGSRGSWVREAP